MLADHLLRLLPMIVSRCLIERGKECDPMIKICHLLLIWRKKQVTACQCHHCHHILASWKREAKKMMNIILLIIIIASWFPICHLPSPWRASHSSCVWGPERYLPRYFWSRAISALGVILLIHADNCCSSDDTFDLGAILGLERDTFDLGEIPIVAVNPSWEYLGADQLEFLLGRNSARCWNFGQFLDPFLDNTCVYGWWY